MAKATGFARAAHLRRRSPLSPLSPEGAEAMDSPVLLAAGVNYAAIAQFAAAAVLVYVVFEQASHNPRGAPAT